MYARSKTTTPLTINQQSPPPYWITVIYNQYANNTYHKSQVSSSFHDMLMMKTPFLEWVTSRDQQQHDNGSNNYDALRFGFASGYSMLYHLREKGV